MARHIHLKDHFAEVRLFNRRAIAAGAFVVLMLGVLIARLVYLQVVQHQHFITLSHDNRVKIQVLPPTRGLIYDRNGLLLAENQPSYRLEVTAEQVPDMKATLKALGEVVKIGPVEQRRFQKLLRRKPRFEAVPLRFHLSDEEVARFAVNRHRFPGVEIAAYPSRHYPLGERAVHLLGYVGRIDENELQRLDPTDYRGTSHVGKVGVEKTYEDLLHGSVGFQQVEANALGRTLRVLEDNPPDPGDNLYLTIDSRVQAAAEDALGEHRGAIVAMEPESGEVLALVSKPGYDPNLFVNGIDPDSYRELQNPTTRPLFNRALRGQYPPGSTLKPFMGLAGLEHRLIHSRHAVFCPGYFMLPGDDHKYRDWKREGHGPVNLRQAVARSCDVYFYDLALSLGIDRIHDFLARFGFGTATGIDLTGEVSGLLPSRAWKRKTKKEPWFPGETLITGIGQGFALATPVQLAAATAALATRGRRVQPRVLHAVEDPARGETRFRDVVPLEPVILDDSRWDEVLAGMIEVVHGLTGTARRIAVGAPYRIAGKTGTAQVFGIKQEEEYEEEDVPLELRDHALFIAFAPAEAPRIALVVIVEHGGSGGSVAAPIARQVLDAYLVNGNGNGGGKT